MFQQHTLLPVLHLQPFNTRSNNNSRVSNMDINATYTHRARSCRSHMQTKTTQNTTKTIIFLFLHEMYHILGFGWGKLYRKKPHNQSCLSGGMPWGKEVWGHTSGHTFFSGLLGLKFYPTTTKTLCEFLHDRYSYLKRWISSEEDSEDSELEGYESSAVMDEEDTEDN